MQHSDLSEDAWKGRFIVRLARLFVSQGLDEKAAIADAAAHADDRYPCREGLPEADADVVYAMLVADMPAQDLSQPRPSRQQQADR